MKNKIKLGILLLLIIKLVPIYAEVITLQECEYTDEYKIWLTLPKEEQEKRPPTAICKTKGSLFDNAANSKATLGDYTASKFNLSSLGYVTSIKNQSGFGTCWAHATMASIESNLLVNRMADRNIDLSEAHLELATQNSLFNPSLMPFIRRFNNGADILHASAYITTHLGPVSESDAPYSLVTNSITASLNSIKGKKVQYNVGDVAMIFNNAGACDNATITDIKKYLVTYGAVVTNMNYTLVTAANGAYYNNTIFGEGYIDHAVTIVGWDDTIARTKFSPAATRNGAWIIKDSHGTSSGDNGYIYVSYDDILICTRLAGYYNISNTFNDNSYIYDTVGITDDYKVVNNNDIYVANVFDKSTNGLEKLKKVTFFADVENNQNIEYDILFSPTGLLTDMTVVATGTTYKAGYTTVDVSDKKALIAKPHFGIVVHFKNAKNKNLIGVYRKITDPQKTVLLSSLNVTKDNSYISTDGKSWTHLKIGGEKLYASVRAFTDNSTDDYLFSVNSKTIVDGGLVAKYTMENVTANNVTYNIYKSTDTSQNTSLNNQFTIQNNLTSSKSLGITTKSDTTTGEYVLITNYNDSKTSVTFYVNDNKTIELTKPTQQNDNDEVFELSTSAIDNNRLITTYNIENTDINNISYNIYTESDTTHTTSLNEQFNIENDLETSNTLIVSTEESTTAGRYYLITNYNNTTTQVLFAVNNNHTIELPITNPNVSVVVNENPENSITPTNTSNTNTNIDSNPQTGSTAIIMITAILIASSIAGYYTYRYYKNSTIKP